MRNTFLDATRIAIGADPLFSKVHFGHAAAIILVLSALAPLAQAQPMPPWFVAYTLPVYLGGSTTVFVNLTNIASIPLQVRQVEVRFDWDRTFTKPLKILQPGESYEWKFNDCPIPENTWTGKHSFTTTLFVSWAQPTGNWTLEFEISRTVQFSVEPQIRPPGSVEEFLASPYGISSLFLFAVSLVTAAELRGASRSCRKSLRRAMCAIIAAIGFSILLYVVQDVLHWDWTMAAFLLFVQACIILASTLSAQLIARHKRLWSISFEKALGNFRPPPLEFGLSCFMLNFTLLTLEFLLPFRDVFVTLLPFLRLAAPLIPGSFMESPFLATTIGAGLWVTLPGLVFLFGLRALRRWNRGAGRRLSELVQVMFYASVLLAVYSCYSGSTLSGGSLWAYGILLALFLLPGSLAIPLMLTLLPRKEASTI